MARGDIVIPLNLENVEVIQDLQARLSAIERQRTESLGTIGGILEQGLTLTVAAQIYMGGFSAVLSGTVTTEDPHPMNYIGCGETVEAAVADAVLAYTSERAP